MYKVLLIEDDRSISELLANHIEKYGIECLVCTDFDNVTEEFIKIDPHLVLMDVNLPKYDGFYWCRKLRQISKCPIIFISARLGDIDQVYAMENGADDYITKPFSFDIVLAKINANLRRVYGDYAKEQQERTLIKGSLIFYFESLILENDDKKVMLTKKEGTLAAVLIENSPKVLSREKLLAKLWDDESFVEENTLNVNVARLRKKIEEIHAKVEIEAVRGLGYRLIGV
ncbi:response regulator transcription factor [Clostridium tagluense]|uniref:response regulator transcription factor n=1 Tax=Clostridium tagluense TaxID=360422 RepID=UPI001CF2C751|nr:response regulator transcription factor [Clostridium tagluense]MCB2314028.1 response regulator transcription factor [Clostridium tagluense]MCB2318865.1 response regulator transcription factor [Clostridium tagluense]MCB2323684.1 response regulator transcription factor [Clostridium tagluense]MCB2328586.1 response regulator transcription factor [Clostridium tagluense]MCB2333442.1 response regulator transcription factor [Clostridium tagluense]